MLTCIGVPPVPLALLVLAGVLFSFSLAFSFSAIFIFSSSMRLGLFNITYNTTHRAKSSKNIMSTVKCNCIELRKLHLWLWPECSSCKANSQWNINTCSYRKEVLFKNDLFTCFSIHEAPLTIQTHVYMNNKLLYWIAYNNFRAKLICVAPGNIKES